MLKNFSIFLRFIYLLESERERERGWGGAQEEEEKKPSQLYTPDVGLDLTTLEVRPELKPGVRHLTN